MWTTLDGNQLVLPAGSLASICEEPDRWEIRELLRLHYGGDIKAALDRVLSELARNATRQGSFRSRTTERVYPVFQTKADGRTYQLVGNPAGGRRYWLLAVRLGPLDDLADFYATYGGQATVSWSGPWSAAAWTPATFPHAGNYIIEKSG